MEQKEMTMGQVTYEISRVYRGDRPISELVMDRMAQNLPANQSIDGEPGEGL